MASVNNAIEWGHIVALSVAMGACCNAGFALECVA
jgi:hypothetical protein